MNRRGFIGSLLGLATAAAVLDPDELLWKPGKLISVPKGSYLNHDFKSFELSLGQEFIKVAAQALASMVERNIQELYYRSQGGYFVALPDNQTWLTPNSRLDIPVRI